MQWLRRTPPSLLPNEAQVRGLPRCTIVRDRSVDLERSSRSWSFTSDMDFNEVYAKSRRVVGGGCYEARSAFELRARGHRWPLLSCCRPVRHPGGQRCARRHDEG